MRKRDELSDPGSCWNKARDGQRVFVLLDHDESFADAVRAWAASRVKKGLNTRTDAKILSALQEADEVEAGQAGGRA